MIEASDAVHVGCVDQVVAGLVQFVTELESEIIYSSILRWITPGGEGLNFDIAIFGQATAVQKHKIGWILTVKLRAFGHNNAPNLELESQLVSAKRS